MLESGRFYDPDRPSGAFAAWPALPGPHGPRAGPVRRARPDRPSYVAFGNHDGEVQGSLHALQALDTVARGCVKPLALSAACRASARLPPTPAGTIVVPPDPDRAARRPADVQGAARDRPAGRRARLRLRRPRRAAGVARTGRLLRVQRRKPGLRLIAINTVAEGDKLKSEGNLDDPQFRWLRGELEAAERRGELVVVFGHHPIGEPHRTARPTRTRATARCAP